MMGRTPREAYFLIVLGVLIAIVGLFVLFAFGITLSFVLALLDQSEAEVGWLDVAGGLLFCSIGATAAVILIKLYRVIERRGAFEPPHRR